MKIGLALAGGGVKGAAHIGVLKALEENEINIDMLSGASIGSIVAVLYAMGYKTDEMLKLFKYFSKEILRAEPKYFAYNVRNVKNIFGYGFLSGESIERAINECGKLKNITNIRELNMPVAITTVDIIKSKKHVFTNNTKSGIEYKVDGKNKNGEYITKTTGNEDMYLKDINIGKAVRASCSYPGMFAPCDVGKYRFVDGGVLDNIPAGELRKMEADKVISVKFSAGGDYNPKSILEVAMKSIDILFDSRTHEATKASDFVLDLELPEASVFNIKKIDYCYQKGYEKTLEYINEIKEIIGKVENNNGKENK